MLPRSSTMKISSGRVINLKFTANSGPADGVKISGSKAVTNIIINIIMQNAIIRYLNLKTYAPLEIIKERLCYVNLRQADSRC